MKHRLPFAVLYEDARLIAIDKPAGLLTTHTHLAGRAAREAQRTAENILTGYIRKGQAKSQRRAWLVHRLDRETSGVLLFAKSSELAEALRDNWNEYASKTYLALAEGEIPEDEGAITSYLRDDPRTYKVSSVKNPADGKYARTSWRKLRSEKGSTLLEVKIYTGRKNQIRAHLSESGHPIAGDVKYGAHKADRLYLHAWKLALVAPALGINLKLESPPPKQLSPKPPKEINHEKTLCNRPHAVSLQGAFCIP